MNFGTHKNPHGDELAAFAFGMRFDPDYREARIITFGSKDEAILAAKQGNVTLVGIGEGAFDEHGKGKSEKECAATLVARRLKLDESTFSVLLEEIRLCDLQAKARGTQIPEILKVLYDHHPEADVIAWGMKAYTTLIEACEAGNHNPRPTGLIEEVSAELTTEFAHSGNNDIMRRAWKDCQTAVNNNEKALTELRTAAEVIALCEGPDVAKQWASMGVKALFHRQLDFEKALDEVNNGWKFGAPCFYTERRTWVTLRGVAIHSDNSQAVRAFRSNRAGNLDLLIVRDSTGRAKVFSNAWSKVPMVLCAKALRLAEAKKRGLHGSVEDLVVEGDCPQVPQWHFFAKGGMVVNGTKSHPDVEPTCLTDNEILMAVEKAFDPSSGNRGPSKQGHGRNGHHQSAERVLPNRVLA